MSRNEKSMLSISQRSSLVRLISTSRIRCRSEEEGMNEFMIRAVAGRSESISTWSDTDAWIMSCWRLGGMEDNFAVPNVESISSNVHCSITAIREAWSSHLRSISNVFKVPEHSPRSSESRPISPCHNFNDWSLLIWSLIQVSSGDEEK